MRTVDEPNRIVICAVQESPWYLVFLKALPQHVTWELRQADGVCDLCCDTRHFKWYTLVIVILNVALAALLWGSIACFVQHRPSNTGWAGFPMLLGSLFLMYFNIRVIGHGESQKMDEWHELLRAKVELAGESIETLGHGNSKRTMVRSVGYLCFVIVVAMPIFFFAPSGSAQIPLSIAILLGLLILLIVCLLVVLPLIVLREGFGFRIRPMMPGMNTLIAIIFLGAVPIPWIVFGEKAYSMPDVVDAARVFLSSDSPLPAKAIEQGMTKAEVREYLLTALKEFRTLGVAAIIAGLFLLGMSLEFFRSAASVTLRAWTSMARLMKNPGSPAVRGAGAGKPWLRSFQVVFSAAWVLMGIATLAMLTHLAYAGFFSLVEVLQQAPESAVPGVQSSLVMTALAFDAVWTDPTLAFLVRAVWVLFAAFAAATFSVSVGGLGLERWRTWRQLTAKGARILPMYLESDPRDALAKLKPWNVSVVVTADRTPYAVSHRFGLIGAKRFIKVSDGCLSVCGPDELKALIAHELAHHLHEHCLLDNFLRLLGRCTFVGDTFVRTLENSIGFEHVADRTAVEKLGASPSALKRALWLIRNNTGAGGQSAGTVRKPFRKEKVLEQALRDATAGGFHVLGWRRKWRLALWLYVGQYTSSLYTSYWHPSIEDRIKALEKMDRS